MTIPCLAPTGAIHAVPYDEERTYCGRDAAEWLTQFGKFISCKICKVESDKGK